MSEISRVALFGKLNSVAYKAIESATVFCKLRGIPYVELAHWIAQIVQTDNTDSHCIVRHFEIDASRLSADVTAALDKLPRGATANSDLSEHVMDISERAWVYGSLMYGEGGIRTGHLIVGALKTPRLLNVLLGISRQFERIRADTLVDEFAAIVASSVRLQPAGQRLGLAQQFGVAQFTAEEAVGRLGGVAPGADLQVEPQRGFWNDQRARQARRPGDGSGVDGRVDEGSGSSWSPAVLPKV